MIKLEKIIKFGIYLAMVLPLVFTSRTMYPWHFGKTVLFQILVEILLVLALIFFSLNKDPAQKQASSGAGRRIVRFNLLDYLVVGFVFLQLISSAWGINFNRSFWGNQQRAQGIFTWLHFTVFYILVRQFFITKKDWFKLGMWAIIILFLSSILAWLGKYFSIFDQIILKESRLSGLIGNPIFFASYLIIPVFLCFVWYFLFVRKDRVEGNNGKAIFWRWFCLIAGIFSLITLIFSQVRGTFLGLLAGIFVIWILYLIYGCSERFKKVFFISGLLILIIFSFVYVFNQRSDYLSKNFPSIARLIDISPSTTTASTRLMAWKIAFKAWQDRPIFGWGPENYQDAFDKYYNPEFLKYSFAETVWDKPHSFPLEVLSETGTAGFACYLALIIVLVFYLIRIIKTEQDDKGRLGAMILVGAVIAYVIQSGFAFETSNSLLMWIVLLALVSYYHSSVSQTKEYDKILFNKFIGWITILAIIAVPYLVYKNYTFYKASVQMGDARDAAEIASVYQWQKNAELVLSTTVPFLWEQAIFLTQDLSSFDGNNKLNKNLLEPVSPRLIEIFEREISREPDSYLYRFWLSQLYGFMGEYVDNKYYQDSNELLKEAWEINPDHQHIPLLLAKNYLLQNKTEEGIEILEELVQKNPEFEEPHWFLGIALFRNGDEDRGVEELEKGQGFGLTYRSNIFYLIDVYAKIEEYDKIIPLYKRLIREDESGRAGYYANLAAIYAALGDEESVIINLNKAVELNPDLAKEAELFLEQQGIDINKYR